MNKSDEIKDNAPEALPKELEIKLKEAEIETNMADTSRFNMKRGGGTAALTACAFMAFGMCCGAPLLNSAAFAAIGAVVGFGVGACRPGRKK